MAIQAGETTFYQAKRGIVQDGLVLNLDAAVDASYSGGTTWRDLAGSNNGTFINMDGTNFSSDNGGLLSFDGSNEKIEIQDNSSLDITSEISLEAWVYATKSNGIQNVICKSSNTQNNAYIFPRTNNGWTQCTFYLNINGWKQLAASWPSRNQWHHTIGVYGGGYQRIYINGQQSAITSRTGSISTNSNPLTLGVQPGYSEWFGGSISNARVYNRALTATEVLQNYNATRHRFGV
jgi:hypothetical protein